MGFPVRREPVHCRVPVEDVRPALEKLLAEYGSRKGLARYLESESEGVTDRSWEMRLKRMLDGGQEQVGFELAEWLCLLAGMDAPIPPYRTAIYRVTGLQVRSDGQLRDRNWFFLTYGRAYNKMRKLRMEGQLVDWAKGDVVWKELR